MIQQSDVGDAVAQLRVLDGDQLLQDQSGDGIFIDVQDLIICDVTERGRTKFLK